MSNSQVLPTTLKRNATLSSIRESLKRIPLQRIASQIQNKLHQKYSTNSELFQQPNKELASNQSETDVSESEQSDLAVSHPFSQKYQLLQKLGEGCNACVYKCQDRHSKAVYAVKKAKIEEQQVAEAKEMFQVIKALEHPEVAYYKEFYYDQQQNLTYTVMEYVPFPNLAECKVQNEQQLKCIIRRLVRVISYLHRNNICHRDIKPENILYDQKTQAIKIIDFGISKKTLKMGEKREMLTIIGSNCYLAPEIYLGGGYDESIDLWSLGVTIFKLVTGQTPFESEYHSQTISKIVKGQVRFMGRQWQSFSPQAQDFVSKLLKGKQSRMTLNQAQLHPWLAPETVY